MINTANGSPQMQICAIILDNIILETGSFDGPTCVNRDPDYGDVQESFIGEEAGNRGAGAHLLRWVHPSGLRMGY